MQDDAEMPGECTGQQLQPDMSPEECFRVHMHAAGCRLLCIAPGGMLLLLLLRPSQSLLAECLEVAATTGW